MKKTATMKSSTSVNEKRAAVSVRLRRGDIAELAVRTGYDKSHVARVLRGESNNPSNEIVNAAYKMVGRRKITV